MGCFEISFLAPEKGSSFFQSVLIPLDPTPALIVFRDSVRQILGFSSHFYFPHLSLFYGDRSAEEREAIVEDLKRDGITQIGSEGVSVAGIHSFEVAELWIVKTEGKVGDWKILEKRSFHAR